MRDTLGLLGHALQGQETLCREESFSDKYFFHVGDYLVGDVNRVASLKVGLDANMPFFLVRALDAFFTCSFFCR